MTPTDWDDLRFVLAVGRAQSFAGAAQVLRVNVTTVTRRVSRYERRLESRLFERIGGSARLTRLGIETMRRAERIELEIEAAERVSSSVDKRVDGTVRLTAACLFTNHVLAPVLPALLDGNPHLQLELIADGRDLSLSNREADIAIRLARPVSEPRSVMKRIGYLPYGVYQSSTLKAGSNIWIAYEDRLGDLPQARWIAEHMEREHAGTPQVLINDAETLMRCVKSGLGKSVLPVSVAGRDPGLIRVDAGTPQMRREIWMVVHEELRELKRIRVAMSWLESVCSGL